jgi:hypothetical protein
LADRFVVQGELSSAGPGALASDMFGFFVVAAALVGKESDGDQ